MADNLNKRKWPALVKCTLCGCKEKTMTHIFLECIFARMVWRQFSNVAVSSLTMNTMEELQTYGRQRIQSMEGRTAWYYFTSAVMWCLQNEQNRRVLRKEAKVSIKLVEEITTLLQNWISYKMSKGREKIRSIINTAIRQ